MNKALINRILLITIIVLVALSVFLGIKVIKAKKNYNQFKNEYNLKLQQEKDKLSKETRNFKCTNKNNDITYNIEVSNTFKINKINITKEVPCSSECLNNVESYLVAPYKTYKSNFENNKLILDEELDIANRLFYYDYIANNELNCNEI